MTRPTQPSILLGHIFKDISTSKLASVLGLDRKIVEAILDGKMRITSDLANRLARLTGTSSSLWLDLQCKHDKYIAEIESDKYDFIEEMKDLCTNLNSYTSS